MCTRARTADIRLAVCAARANADGAGAWEAAVVRSRREFVHCDACGSAVRATAHCIPRDLHASAIATAQPGLVAYALRVLVEARNTHWSVGVGEPLGSMHAALVIVHFSQRRREFVSTLVDAHVYKYSDTAYLVIGETFMLYRDAQNADQCPRTHRIVGEFASIRHLVAHLHPRRRCVQVGAQMCESVRAARA